MMRFLVILIAVFAMGVALPGCGDSSAGEAEDMGFQTGQRPVKETKRPPPGPTDAGFEQAQAEGVGDAPPDDEPD